MLRVSAPQGVSLDYTTQQMRRIEATDPAAARSPARSRRPSPMPGQGGSDQQRLHGHVAGAVGQARAQRSRRSSPTSSGWSPEVPGVRAFPVTSPTASASAAPATACSSPSSATAMPSSARPRNKILAEMEKDPRFQQPRLSNDATQPQLSVEIDRERASDLGIDITGLAEAAAGDARRQRRSATSSSTTAPMR